MRGINEVIVGGNLTRDPVIRYTPNEKAVAIFTIAINEQYKTATGERKEAVCFIDIEAWDRLAENCKDHISKGSPVLIEGKIRQDNWTGKESGAKRSKHKIKARMIHFLNGPKREEKEEDGLPGFGD